MADAREFLSGPQFGLHVVFTNFVRLSERKLDACLEFPVDVEPDIDGILGKGVDLSFDKVLASLGYIARHKPKPVIDSVMFWRKSKSEAAAAAAAAAAPNLMAAKRAQSPPDLLRRNTEPPTKANLSANQHNGNTAHIGREAALLADRRSLISIYILCRVLIEVVSHTPAEALGEELGDKLEEIVFNQLRLSDPDSIQSSSIRASNWHLFSKLLGSMSDIRFLSVSDRFVADLERYKGLHVTRDKESKIELVIHGMRYLQLKMYPMNALEDSADFLNSIAGFFANSHGQRIKHAYATIFNTMLLPVAGNATAELDIPTWASAINSIYPKARDMCLKQRHWNHCFPLACTLLCVAPKETFAQNWLSLVEAHATKLKDRVTRRITMECIARLVWVYMFRCSESLNNSTKKLDAMFKLVLVQTRKSTLVSDPHAMSALVQMIRFVAAKYFDYAFRNVILPLLGSESLGAYGGSLLCPLENIQPDRFIVSIRSFLWMLHDLEHPETTPAFPVDLISTLPEAACSLPNETASIKEARETFSQLLGVTVATCDHYHGGQAILDEKFGQQPRTPVSSTFSFSSEQSGASPRQAFFDLLAVCFEALPSCLLKALPSNRLVDMLCKGTAHSDAAVARAAATALQRIARQNHSQMIVTGFARFIFNFDERYSTTSDGGMLGSGHIESTLKLYTELLQTWADAIRSKAKTSEGANLDEEGSRSEELETASIWTVIEEIESNGLFFLCSQSRLVRRYAIMVLRLMTEFDAALDDIEVTKSHGRKPSKATSPVAMFTRIIDVLNHGSATFLNFNLDTLSVAERSRLQKLQQGKSQDILVRLVESENGIDAALWFRIFPKFVQECFVRFPMTVVLCRNSVCARLLQMQSSLRMAIESMRSTPASPFEIAPKSTRLTSSPEVMIEQWKLYLIVACSTMTVTDEQVTKFRYEHGRKRSIADAPFERIISARALFQMVIPHLSVEHTAIREAVVTGLGCININLCATLIEELQPSIRLWAQEDPRIRQQRSVSFSRRNRRQDRIIAEITHILQLTSHFLVDESQAIDDKTLQTLVVFVKDTKNFLSDPDVQYDWEYQKLRRWFCGLVETLYEGVRRTGKASHWLPFEGRVSLFRLIEEWCGYGQHTALARERETRMRRTIHELHKDVRDRGALAASMEIEKRNLEIAALSAMTSLCAGPVISTSDTLTAAMSFDVDGVFKWINVILASKSDRLQRLGRTALKNLLVHNAEFTMPIMTAISRSYSGDSDCRETQSYFSVVSETLVENPLYPYEFRQALALGLFKIGDENAGVRGQAAKLLKAAETRFCGSSCLDEYEISISDKTTAVFKEAQYLLSARLAKDHAQETLGVFSEFTLFFGLVDARMRRDITEVLLPWVQTVELQLDPNASDLSPATFMVLANLFEITVKFGDKMRNEIAALWIALASGPHPGNVKAALDFVMQQSLERRDPSFVEYGKQILVFLARTAPGSKLVEALIGYLQPRSMIPHVVESTNIPGSPTGYPYVTNLSDVLPPQSKQVVFSYGQLALVLLVDLLIKPIKEMSTHLPLLLHVVFTQMDHYVPIIQEQAREMLVHLIHELTIRNQNVKSDTYDSTISFIDNLRSRDSKTIWHYDENGQEKHSRTPAQMEYMVHDVISIFLATNIELRQQWGVIALAWATSCPVRHLACRSFQIFRCLMAELDSSMLADMLARLSNTVADNSPDIQGFAMEILTTINAVVDEASPETLSSFPQLFWATAACLSTIHEQEFLESLSTMQKLLAKIDVNDEANVEYLLLSFPERWEGKFDGIQALILKGLRSSVTLGPTFSFLNELNRLPSSEIVGGDSRLQFAVLAGLPYFLHACETSFTEEVCVYAERLSKMAEEQNYSSLSKVLLSVSKRRFRAETDLLNQTVASYRESFFPEWQAPTLIFILGLLSNKVNWMKVKTLDVLKTILPHVDLWRPELSAIGADLIFPLLRLLSTDYAQQALEVLDHAKSIAGGPTDKTVLRMSLSNRAVRKEYEKTATLFGIPEESGWAVPMPSNTAAICRNNVHAVFYTWSTAEVDRSSTEEVQFHMEDYSYLGPQMDGRTATMVSDEREQAGSFGELVSTLHSLDVFFTEDMSSTHQHTPSQTETEISMDPGESGPAVYDSRVAGILGRSLGRTPSITSLRTSLADSLANPNMDSSYRRTTNPHSIRAVFHSPPQPHTNAQSAASRPPVTPRSVSSPILKNTGYDWASDGELDEFGDPDDEVGSETSRFHNLFKGASQIGQHVAMKARLKTSMDGLREKQDKRSPPLPLNPKHSPKTKMQKEAKVVNSPRRRQS